MAQHGRHAGDGVAAAAGQNPVHAVAAAAIETENNYLTASGTAVRVSAERRLSHCREAAACRAAEQATLDRLAKVNEERNARLERLPQDKAAYSAALSEIEQDKAGLAVLAASANPEEAKAAQVQSRQADSKYLTILDEQKQLAIGVDSVVRAEQMVELGYLDESQAEALKNDPWNFLSDVVSKVGQVADASLGVAKGATAAARSSAVASKIEILPNRNTRVLTFKEARALTGEEKGLIYVTETPSKMTHAQDFQDATSAAFSDLATRKSGAPALVYKNSNKKGMNYIKFDGVGLDADGNSVLLVDAKTKLATWGKKTVSTLWRVEAALKQNPGFKVVYEFPNSEVERKAWDFLMDHQLAGPSLPAAPRCGAELVTVYTARSPVRGVRIMGDYLYRGEQYIYDDRGSFDAHLEFRFKISNKNINYKRILNEFLPEAVEGYGGYRAIVSYGFHSEDYAGGPRRNNPIYKKLLEDPAIDVNGRNNIYTLRPAQFWDGELCQRALGFGPDEVVARLRGECPMAKRLMDGVYLVLNDDPHLPYEDFVEMNERIKPILGLI